jgi:hypothetical protein
MFRVHASAAIFDARANRPPVLICQQGVGFDQHVSRFCAANHLLAVSLPFKPSQRLAI